MNGDNAYQRDCWQIMSSNFQPRETPTSTSSAQGILPRDSTSTTTDKRLHDQASTDRTTKKTMSTMEALGIRLGPPGFQSPAASSLYYQQPTTTRVMHENIYAANQLTSQPHQQPWNAYAYGGVGALQYQPSPNNYPSGNEFLYMPSIGELVGQSSHSLKQNDSVEFDPDLRPFQYALLYPEMYQKVDGVESAGSHSETNSNLLAIDYNYPGVYQNPLPLANTQQAPVVEELDLLSYPETASCPSSEYTPKSTLTLSSTTLSPVPSPRCPQSELAKGINRFKATPSPRLNKRVAPYDLDDLRKRWSTGSYASSPARRSSPLARQTPEHVQKLPPSYRYSAPAYSSSYVPSTGYSNPPVIVGSSSERLKQPAALLPSNASTSRPTNPTPRKMFKTLHSNVDADGRSLDQFAGLSEPPDLFGPLATEPKPPPANDMNPDDPELIPHEQDLRFDNDLYTPRWVRGHGNKREGWCGICKPGRWLVLKNSAFWYDKSFSHGISAATGQAFEGPKESRRMEGEHHADMWEGLCGSCGEWIPLISSKKKGTTWFRHAYKCQSRSKDRENTRQRSDIVPSASCAENHSSTPAPLGSLYVSASESDSGVVNTVNNLQTLAPVT